MEPIGSTGLAPASSPFPANARAISRGWAVGALVLWLSAIAGGFSVLIAYKSAPGASPEPPPRWPSSTSIARTVGLPTLVMFVHPHCDCSRASVAELGRMMTRADGRMSAHVVFIRPAGTPSGWEHTSLRDAVHRIPGVTLSDDLGGVEAQRFGASTSGTCVLYDAAGELLFAGGITAMRGHEGNSLGQERVLALLTRGETDRPDAPVFGCKLDDAESARVARVGNHER